MLNEMIPNLEEGPEPIRLCIGHARDFVPGANLFDSITDAIHQSRKTIVVLSPELCRQRALLFRGTTRVEETSRRRS